MMAVGASGAFAFELFTRLAGKEFITFLWLTAAFCGVCAETSVLLLRHAAMALSLPSEREALAPRRELIGFTVLNLFVACLLMLGLDGDADIAAVVGIAQLLWLLPFALLAVSEHDGWSKAHASLGWQKPGALRSTLTVWALVAITAIVLTASRFVLGGRHHVADTVLIVGAAYVVLFTAMAAFFGRTIRFTSVPVAVVTRLAFAISLVLGIGTSVFMMVLTQSSARHGMALHVFNPPAVMLELVDRSDEHVGFTFFLAVITGTAALVALGTLGHEDEERLA